MWSPSSGIAQDAGSAPAGTTHGTPLMRPASGPSNENAWAASDRDVTHGPGACEPKMNPHPVSLGQIWARVMKRQSGLQPVDPLAHLLIPSPMRTPRLMIRDPMDVALISRSASDGPGGTQVLGKALWIGPALTCPRHCVHCACQTKLPHVVFCGSSTCGGGTRQLQQ